MTPEHKAKMAAGRERTRAAKAAAAVRKAQKGEGKGKPVDGALEAWMAKQGKFMNDGTEETVGSIETRAAKRKEMTIEQAKMILAANQIGIDFSAEKLAEAQRVLNPPEPVLAPGEIDYERLADLVAARLRPAEVPVQLGVQGGNQPPAWSQQNGQMSQGNVIAYPPVTRDDRGMPVEAAHQVDPHRVAKGSRMERILKQLTYPPDREGQVAAMVAANMAPSWGEGNQEVGDSPYPPPSEAALVAYMQEYCMSLRPELPKPRLEPKYKLASEKAAGQ